jgi:broad specificity phosphatase PhoE
VRAAGLGMNTAPGETLESKRAAAPAPGAIIIARHGKPDCDRRQRLDWRAYVDWWAGYERSGLEPDQAPPAALLAEAARADAFYSSNIRRAIETARAVAGGKPVTEDAVFAEAPLPPPRIWGKRRPRHWGVLARISWWLGNAYGEETRQEAEQRARRERGDRRFSALRGETVVLLAHGWFNRMMRPVLKRQGWVETANHGDRYWAFRRYEKRR